MPLPFIAALDPLDVRHEALYMERIFRADDTRLHETQGRVVIHSAPCWYADEETGLLTPIDVSLKRCQDRTKRKPAVGTISNTLDFFAADDGDLLYTLKDHFVRLTAMTRGATSANYASAPASRKNTLTTRAMAGVTIVHKVLPGRVKETITLGSPGAFLAWAVESNLTPAYIDGALAWQSNGSTVLVFEAPVAWDSIGTPVPCWYDLSGDTLSIGLDDVDAVYPVTIDPTVTTDQGDATANRSTFEPDYGEHGETGYKSAYMKVTLPDLTDQTLTAATWSGYVSARHGGAQNTGDWFCDVVGAWSESTGYAALEALSFNAACGTASAVPDTGNWHELNIFGNASKGLSKAYTDSSTPDPATIKINSDQAVTPSDQTTIVAIGVTEGAGESGVTYAARTDGTNYWRVTLTYGAAGSGSAQFDHHYKMLRNQ